MINTISKVQSANAGWSHARPVQPRRRPLLAVISSQVLLFFIQLYRYTISPAQTFLFGATSGCRFTPTCSQYAKEAIEEHGAMTGSLLAFKRICRCHPFGGCGHDPVPSFLTKKHLNAH